MKYFVIRHRISKAYLRPSGLRAKSRKRAQVITQDFVEYTAGWRQAVEAAFPDSDLIEIPYHRLIDAQVKNIRRI